MTISYVGLGSNLSGSMTDPRQQLNKAVQRLSEHPRIHGIILSSFYSTSPIGPKDQPDYINAVARLHTELLPLELLDYLQEIEDEHDKEEDNIIDYGDGRYLLQANTPLVEFNEFFESSIVSDNYDTVAGLVISGFSYLPEQMSEISLYGFDFKVLKTDTRRLLLLEVQRQIIDIKSSKDKVSS